MTLDLNCIFLGPVIFKKKKQDDYFCMDYLFHLASLNATENSKQKKSIAFPPSNSKIPGSQKLWSGFPFSVIYNELGKMDILIKNLAYFESQNQKKILPDNHKENVHCRHFPPLFGNPLTSLREIKTLQT